MSMHAFGRFQHGTGNLHGHGASASYYGETSNGKPPAASDGQTYGPKVIDVPVTDAANGNVLNSILAFIQSPQTQESIQGLVNQYGPAVRDVVAEAVSNSGQSLGALRQKLAKKQGKLATTTNAGKRAKLVTEIQTLQAQIQAALTSQVQAAPVAYAPPQYAPANSGGIPAWIPYAGAAVAVVAVIVIVTTATRKPRARKNPRTRARRR